MSTPLVARVALVEGHRIIEDRTLGSRVGVEVGSDASNTLVTPLTNWPRRFGLLTHRRERFFLRFTAQMRGKVFVGGAEHTLEQLLVRGHAMPDGADFVVPLEPTSRGRVSLGDTSVLFQFVAPPTRPPPPQLPPEAKGGLLGQIDRMFMVVLAVSLGVHFTGALYTFSQPTPVQDDVPLAEVLERWNKITVPQPPKLEAKRPAAQTVAKATAKSSEAPLVAPRRPNAAEVRVQVANAGLLAVLGANGDHGNGIADLMADVGKGPSLEELMRDGQLKNATVSLDASQRKGADVGGAAQISIGTRALTQVSLKDRDATQVPGTVGLELIQTKTTALDPRAITDFVSSHKGALVSCYESELKRNPSLRGRVTVRFEISTLGRIGEVDFDDDTLRNQAVTDCIRARVQHWLTPFRPDDEVPVAFPFVFTPTSG